MSILHQEGSFFYCPFFTDLFKDLLQSFDFFDDLKFIFII